MSEHEQDAPIALVAGASRGLGLLVARELGRRGHRVVICARDEDELLRGAQLLQSDGVDVVPRVCDVADRDAVEQLVSDVEANVGPIATLVTVAGVINVGPLESMTEQHFSDAVNIMLWGPVHLSLAVLPHMRRRRAGRIGTVTSIGGLVSVPHLVPYSTAKFGAVGFSQGLAAELVGTGVTATTIVPGLMRTGGHLHAQFTGQQNREYVWFAASGSLPLISMDAERAAAKMVRAVLAGKPTVILTPLAKIGARVHGLAPATTVRVMKLANRFLPSAPAGGHASTMPGHAVDRRLDSRLFESLIALGQKAARRFNETSVTRVETPRNEE
ncbi:MAG TPA: SDR family oxidoreductase [Propionibacteriaceae bacterium]|nr:SDR family oxidoreductase [Propionibacteriaceae bacterium]